MPLISVVVSLFFIGVGYYKGDPLKTTLSIATLTGSIVTAPATLVVFIFAAIDFAAISAKYSAMKEWGTYSACVDDFTAMDDENLSDMGTRNTMAIITLVFLLSIFFVNLIYAIAFIGAVCGHKKGTEEWE